MPFTFEEKEIPGVVVIEYQKFDDNRGFFMETFREADFSAHGITLPFVQDNYSHSVRGVLRGLHYQKNPRAQGKLILVLKGAVFDVGVDIRRGSPTYGKWIGEVLDAENRRMLYLPPGMAHGFCVLSDEVDFFYKVTADYAPEMDRGFIWNDPEIGIKWPITNPVLSDKDKELPPFRQADNNYVFYL
ncbi:MAG: dTDP-4-dehydrorhamnose 3,5-epimerase [Candidatus Euphemobacter frigidus]|nr:dTDP-4-dehydrorhamnose 3,5-epimerase [Candidatus Euphemobacter frigidus]MDP8275775.1 dTDP-4-dehydrorhamnose 3,5-epimerase [Candidatus Euphemobacter frigidus]